MLEELGKALIQKKINGDKIDEQEEKLKKSISKLDEKI